MLECFGVFLYDLQESDKTNNQHLKNGNLKTKYNT